MLPADCSRRLLAELRGALDACAERQRQLERSLRVCRRLLRAWEPAEAPKPEPEANEGDAPPGSTPSPQELGELELLSRALEKAVRVRKSVSKAKAGRGPCLKPGALAAAPPGPSGPSGSPAPPSRPPRAARRTQLPAQTPELSAPAGPGPSDQQAVPAAAALRPPEVFTLKEKGTLLQLPTAFRKAAAQNSRLWAQLRSTQPGDPAGVAAAKAQFLRKMQAASGRPGLSAAEVEAEAGRLWKACSLLRLRARDELAADPADWLQEYRGLLALEGLQALAERCLQRLQELRAAVTEQQLQPWPEGTPSATPAPCGGGPQLLLYSSTRELQALAALQLRVAVLGRQVHLQKVLMAELLPLARAREPGLGLCRALHCLLCEGGEGVLCALRDPPAR